MTLKKCPSCKSIVQPRPGKTEQPFLFGSTRIMVVMSADKCRECKEIFIPYNVLGKAEWVVSGQLAQHGPICPESFRFMRKALGLRAKDLGDLFALRAETISRWETRAAPLDRSAWFAVSAMVLAARSVLSLTWRDMEEIVKSSSSKRKRVVRLGAVL